MSAKRPNLVRVLATAVLLLAGALSAAHGAARLPRFFSDHMVLQRDKPVPVWGWADPGESVTVAFAGQTHTATADAEGRWKVMLDPLPAAADGRKLVVTAGNTITRKDVVVGDVWLCSGQSNMEWTQNRSMQAKVFAARADTPQIRHLKIPHVNAALPRNDVKASWAVCSPKTVGHFTAVGYYFAAAIRKEVDVPIGLIGSNWGGTRIEPWTAPEGFDAVKELKSFAKRVRAWDPGTEAGKASWNKKLEEYAAWVDTARTAIAAGKHPPQQPAPAGLGSSHQLPCKLYNGMIHPLLPYAIRGAIWYQGESNGREGETYYHKMHALVKGWRTLFGQGDFPFYWVQLANFRAPTDNPAGGDGWAKLREAQRHALDIPNTGMAVIIDIGEARNIHPGNKQDVGARLARWALAKEYGKDIVYSGPLYKSHSVEDGAIRIAFDHVGAGLIVGEKKGLAPVREVEDGTLKRFAIAGEDKKWHWADARIDGETVVVSSEMVPAPVAVRYAFSMNPEGANLYNKEGLPASPFRTDSW